MMEKLKYIKLILSMMLLLLASDIYGQSYTVTASNHWNFSNISVTYCGSNVWKVKAYQSNQWQQGRLNIRVNGSKIGKTAWNVYGYSTNQQYDASNGGMWAIGGHSGRWVYVKVEPAIQKAYGYFSDFPCSSCTTPGTPGTNTAINPTCNGFTARWGASSNSPTGYYLYVSTASNFSSYVSGFNGKNVGNTTSYAVTGLSPGVKYYYRVKAYKTGCSNSGYSGTMNTTTSAFNAGSIPSTSTSPTAICEGQTSTISSSSNASGGSGIYYKWQYKYSTNNGSTWTGWYDATGTNNLNSYTIPNNLVAGRRYRFRRKAGSSCSGLVWSSNAADFNVTASPTVGTVTGASRCGTGTLQIKADVSAGTVRWWTASSGGSQVGTSGDNVLWTTPSISSTTTYYAEAINGSCVSSSRKAVTAIVNVNPSITSSSSGSRCNSGTVDISATSSAGSIDWYTSSTGGSSIGSSNSDVNWTTPSISSTTTYYAEGVNGSCISSSRTAVTATVNTASVGPGGVTDELMVWLKADDASLGSTWQDHSCNGYDYTKVTGPTLVNNGWNHNPSIEILSGGFDAPAGAELGTEWTVFFVSALKSSDKNGRLIEGHTGNYLLGYHGGYRNSIYWNGGSAAEHNSGIASTVDVESPHIFMYKRENTGGNISTKIDGDYKKTFTSTNSGSGIRLDINQGTHKNTESTHSRIGEFIIYNKTLSDVEVRKVEAYLATKYGIVLSDDDGGTGGDYISTGGTTYWDASERSGYTNDVVVIGKDNSTALTQKQAKSKDDSLQVFISSLASNNSVNSGAISNNESFIAIGHNGGKLKTSESANTEKPASVFSRFEREWCLTNTNFTDDFSLKVEWDSAGTFDINDIRLLVDDDGDFSNASVYGPADGLTFSIGSIVVGGASSSMFPSGDTKYFTLASSSESTPLPIELLYFTANKEEGYIILNWETAMEINNDYFIVEKSSDGINWEQITTVPGAGISTSSITYVYVDRDICENTCYYRLTQVDYDGTSETFKTIRVNADIYNDVINMEVVPNPVSSKANVSVNAYEDGVSYFKVLNIQGDLIYTATVPIYKGVNYFDINMSIYESGTYYFNIQMESGQTKTVPVVKK